MLDLKLRSEFRPKRLKRTAIDFNKEIEKNAKDFLEITYPSNDLLKTIESVSLEQSRPIVLIGSRGQGKSHLLTTIYHSFINTEMTKNWLENWSVKLNRAELNQINLRKGMHVIAESLHYQNYKYLWDLILEKHPHGKYIRGKWEGQGDKKTDVLGRDLLIEMFKEQPTVVILDEFQTWYDALTNTKQYPWKNWAFNFVQTLAEIAEEFPDLLILVVSVRNGQSDAYQQIHRNNPIIIDFKGHYVKRDRKRLLLHRLFENRSQISNLDINNSIQVHLNEYYRLLQISETERAAIREEFIESWPFSPQLIQLLEDQILVATDAQETRDLIKILANLFKQQTEDTCIITAGSFSIEEDDDGIMSLLDTVSNEYHKTLREKAQRNLQAVRDAVNYKNQIPHASYILSSLWIHSLAINKQAGAERAILQVDITQREPIDDNSFLIEMTTIIDNSFNIHEVGDKLVFKEEENPQAKLLAFSRNDKLFQDGSDIDQLAKQVRYVIGGEESVTSKYQVVVLKSNWNRDPWSSLEDNLHPSKWDNRIPIVVIPESLEEIEETLGKWLIDHVPSKRNTIRFLIPKRGQENIYTDYSLLVLARATLKANEWKKNEPEYRALSKKYQDELKVHLNSLFDRFAILDTWNYSNPKECVFHIENHQAKGKDIPETMDSFIKQSIFDPEEFNDLVIELADNNDSVSRLLSDLQEPRPGGQECIPWLGETEIKDKLIHLCAKGKIAIDLRGMELLILKPGENEQDAWHRMKGKLGTGNHLNQTYIKSPSAITSSTAFIISPTSQDETDSTTGNENIGNTLTSTGSLFGQQETEKPPYFGENHVVNIFDPNQSNVSVKRLQADQTSSLNLIGKIERWGINPGTKIKSISLNINEMTGAQLQQLLRVLPDGVTYGLELDKEE
ncbi:DUF499 domain-containing protein [Ureibacillus sinduriensis]|uniref:DUF499 domain-containing protein n=1 Tax=Ureibacillus sinduriensis BLB-1 = JCM 15800 TaxID=1384057 RepID=A0A0A3HS42_9BACL|nr:DUF499 domain-containing protein [Ureibacillus sinduriensis]KGR75219.1 hypothetical protein CD33_13215 [Ureibacillus sinduriensis BLB-1 = JCM 15800]